MASRVIGLLGLKRSGKDSFASRLVEAHGFTRLAFADALKATMYDLDPFVEVTGVESRRVGHACGFFTLRAVVDRLGWEKAKEIAEVRRLLQAHGVAIRDHVDPDVWVNAVRSKARDIDGDVVVTDVRFPNEIEWVARQHYNGATVRIVRPGQEATDRHISETALAAAETDYTVHNDGTLLDLEAKADLFVSKL